MYYAFVVLTFVLGMWAGFGWSAAVLRARTRRIEEQDRQIQKMDIIFNKWIALIERVEKLELDGRRAIAEVRQAAGLKNHEH